MTADGLAEGVASLPDLIQQIAGLVGEVDVHFGRERRYQDIHTTTADPNLPKSATQSIR